MHFNFVRLPSDVQPLSFCPSDCASLYHNGVRRSGVYTIVLSPGTARPVYCDMETEGETAGVLVLAILVPVMETLRYYTHFTQFYVCVCVH